MKDKVSETPSSQSWELVSNLHCMSLLSQLWYSMNAPLLFFRGFMCDLFISWIILVSCITLMKCSARQDEAKQTHLQFKTASGRLLSTVSRLLRRRSAWGGGAPSGGRCSASGCCSSDSLWLRWRSRISLIGTATAIFTNPALPASPSSGSPVLRI